jgi:hypothetical protein
LPTIEIDDSILKRTDPRVNAHLYQLLDIFHKISNELSALGAGFYASAYSIVSWLQLGQPRIGIKPTQ